MGRLLTWLLRVLFVRLVWTRGARLAREKAVGLVNVDNLLGQVVGTWWRMRKLRR